MSSLIIANKRLHMRRMDSNPFLNLRFQQLQISEVCNLYHLQIYGQSDAHQMRRHLKNFSSNASQQFQVQ